MNKKVLFTLLFSFSCIVLMAQNQLSDNPDSARFITRDIDNFWKAFVHFKRDTTLNRFGPEYIDLGSKGVQGFMKNRIRNADYMFAIVKRKQDRYKKVSSNTMQKQKIKNRPL